MKTFPKTPVNKRKPTLSLRLGGLFAIALLASSSVSQAASGTWITLTSGSSWSNTANWQGGVVASGTDATADFNSIDITTAVTTVHLDTNHTLGYLIFGDTVTSSAASWLLDSNPVGKTLTLATSTGTTPTITVNALGSSKLVTISGTVAGTQGLTKAGAGTLTLTGANNYSGGTTISGGILQIGSNSTGNLGAGDVLIGSGATLQFSTSGTSTVSNNISGAGTLTKSTGGIVVFTGSNNYTGVTNLNNGTLRAGAANALAWRTKVTLGSSGSAFSCILDLGSGTTSSDQTIAGLTAIGTALSANVITNSDSTASFTHTATLTLNPDGALVPADSTFAGVIADGASSRMALTKAGSHTLTLTGTNTYSGATIVTGGTLALSGSGSIATSTKIIVGSIAGSTAKFNVSAVTGGFHLAGSQTLAGQGLVSGTMTIDSGATISPADATTAGKLTTSSVTFADGSAHLEIQLGQTTANDNDQLATDSAAVYAVTLNGADLALTLGTSYSHVDDQLFLIVNNANSGSTLLGQFAQGASIVIGGETFNIIYGANYNSAGAFVGMSGGNDIALMAVPEPTTWAMMIGGFGILILGQRLRRRSAQR